MDEEENNLIETQILNDYDDSIDEVDHNIIMKEVVKDINKSSAEYTEDNSNDEDNEDSPSAEEQNTKDSDSVKTPPIKKHGRPKKIIRANENKSSCVKRRGRPRKSNDESKKQTIGSKRKESEYKVEDDDDNDGTKVTTTSSKCKKHKKNIKISDENKKNIKIRTRTTPTTLFNAMAILNVHRKKCLYEMGFGSMIGMAIHELLGMQLLYLHYTKFNDFDVTHQIPAIKHWKSIQMKHKEKLEIEKYGRFGMLPKKEALNLQSKDYIKMIKEKCYNIHQDLISVREKLDEGLLRFPDCKKLNMFREKFEETTTGDEATEHEDVHHILNEDDKVDDSCPATEVCSVIEGDEVKLTEVEDVEKEKQQIGNEDDRVVDDSDTTIPDSVTEGKGVKFIENDNVLVDDVPNEMIKCSFEEQKNIFIK
nr:ulp1 protease family, C-terminal catalytic domain-containing protein [Tanacetum cinerariifolium]